MKYEFRDRTLGGAVEKALSPNRPSQKGLEEKGFEQAQVAAPPLFWGRWVRIFTQFGVRGPDAENHVTRVNVSFDTASRPPSTFDFEIRGGDSFIRSFGPGSETVTVTGNQAVTLEARCKSHSSLQNVFITADW